MESQNRLRSRVNVIIYIHRWIYKYIYKYTSPWISQQVVSKPSFDQRGHSACSDLTINESFDVGCRINPSETDPENAICRGSWPASELFAQFLQFLVFFVFFVFFVFLIFLIFLIFILCLDGHGHGNGNGNTATSVMSGVLRRATCTISTYVHTRTRSAALLLLYTPCLILHPSYLRALRLSQRTPHVNFHVAISRLVQKQSLHIIFRGHLFSSQSVSRSPHSILHRPSSSSSSDSPTAALAHPISLPPYYSGAYHSQTAHGSSNYSPPTAASPRPSHSRSAAPPIAISPAASRTPIQRRTRRVDAPPSG